MLFSLLYFLVRRLLGAGGGRPDERDIEHFVLRHQLKVLRRHVSRPRLDRPDRVLFAALGSGGSEYEWAWRIPAASMPALVAALDGQAGADPLDVVSRWSMVRPDDDPGPALKRADVPLELWNRVGDLRAVGRDLHDALGARGSQLRHGLG